MIFSLSPSERSGFTLLEIMVVLLIMSMLLGLGVGAFSKVGSGPSLALGRIKNVVRTARYHAIREKAPGSVRIDVDHGVIVGMGWRNVGCWHFEDVSDSASFGFPVEAVLGGATLSGMGVIGSALDLRANSAGSGSKVFVPSSPSLGSVDGVALEAYVYQEVPGPCTIISKGKAYRLDVDEEGRLRAALTLMKGGPSSGEPGEEVSLTSDSFVMPARRWVRVGLQFNGYSFYLLAHGIVRNREQFKNRRMLYPHTSAPIMIDSGETRMNGLMDELRISAAALDDENPFHESIRLLGKTRTVHFDSKGMLNKDFHTKPVQIEFFHGEAVRYKVTIGLLGEVK